MNKRDKSLALQKIADEIAHCAICKKGKSGLPVPGEGNPDAKIVFMGEAPGKTEAATGRPFVGRSGKLLRTMIRDAGLSEDDIFITSPVKYLPDRGTPTPSDIAHGMIHTQQQLDVIDPKIIVLLGSSAVQGVLGEKLPIVKRHGEVIEKNGRKYLIMFHPSAVLRFPNKYKDMFIKDFQKLREEYKL